MFSSINLGSLPILIAELMILAGFYYLAIKILIPRFFGNIIKVDGEENISKANNKLYFFVGFTFIYFILEYLGQEPWILHIAMTFVVVMFSRSIIHPLVLEKWGKDSFNPLGVDDENLTKKLNELFKQADKNRVIYNDVTYIKKAGEISKRLPTKKDTSKSKFMEGIFTLVIWSFFVLTIIYVFKVDLDAPEILVTFFGFVIIYVLSSFYPDLYSTYILAQDEELTFGSFVKISVGDKSYFGSIELMNFFKVQLKDWYNNNVILIYHKLFFGSVITFYPNGRFITRNYGLSEKGQEIVYESLSEWLKDFNQIELFEKISVTRFGPDFSYGVKFRIKVKHKYLSMYGILNDSLDDFIVKQFKVNNINHTTPVLEVHTTEKPSKKI